MRAYTPGGRFDSDFDLDSMGDGITADLTNPAGTVAEWWKFNQAASVVDPIYDVEPIGGGRLWKGPFILQIARASVSQGNTPASERGFYNADTLHITLNVDDFRQASPELFSDRGLIKSSLDIANRYRLVWKGQVYRPVKTQQSGQVADRHTIVTLDLIQLMPDELVNDTQFLKYAQA
jgi:hypothetical protein